MAGINGPDRKPWLHGRCESLRVDTNFNAAVINGFDLPGQALIDLTEIQNGPDFGIVRLTDDGAGVGRFTSSALVDADIPANIARDPIGLGFATRDAPNTPLALRAIADADIPPNIVRDPVGVG